MLKNGDTVKFKCNNIVKYGFALESKQGIAKYIAFFDTKLNFVPPLLIPSSAYKFLFETRVLLVERAPSKEVRKLKASPF